MEKKTIELQRQSPLLSTLPFTLLSEN